jgi:hypothetical protein
MNLLTPCQVSFRSAAAGWQDANSCWCTLVQTPSITIVVLNGMHQCSGQALWL